MPKKQEGQKNQIDSLMQTTLASLALQGDKHH